ncbi:MAG: hypothetical protein ACK4OE_04705 [Acidovorax sp.]|uniref:hypothetical protein n=1 Tax=Acidovorax sp. TaxID=1872122 RepID=UPI00391DF8B4
MNRNFFKQSLVWTTSICMGLSACGGGDSTTPSEPPLVNTPAPLLTYTPDPTVCAWMVANIKPFVWPAQTVGPRTWPPVEIQKVDKPLRNAAGLAQYQVWSNLWVLQSHYVPQIDAKGMAAYSSSQVWAQEASCKYGFSVDAQNLTAFSYSFSAYMQDSTADQIAKEEYTSGVQQVPAPDPCKPGPVFPTAPPLPPECTTTSL